MGSNYGSRPKRGLFLGIAIVAVGVILLLDQEGLISADRIFHFFWPAVFIFFGVESIFFSCESSHRRAWGWVILIFGVLLLGSHLGFRFLRVEDLWPLVLIFIGGVIVARTFGLIDLDSQDWHRWKSGWRIGRNDRAEETTDSQFDYLAIFGGVNQRIYSNNFRGGNLLAICGGFDLDLRRADIEGESAAIDASAFMGGGQIRVPETWIVDIRGTAIMGGYTDETAQMAPQAGTPQKRLIVKGIVVFGGVVVKN
jgi:hypothetical protein